MSPAPPVPAAASLQAGLFEFAIAELVRQHRGSFAPLWTTESWAKLMIWLALNSGGSGDRSGLESFAAALGPALAGRMRRLFFERELDGLGLKLLADPADPQVLVLPLASEAGDGQPLDLERVAAALAAAGLEGRVSERGRWQKLEALVAVPWRDDP
ncbi:protein phosphatase [Synechococcus sp. CS-602]|uniref:protein phosphatase n=1 Tax=Synechococcaceae TaxID=1890426 RepID=UPI0008FF76E1|nr:MULTISPECIES: protein phosphatase [Synechococcaceae]APD49332.1 protein phosphatase [Synechococcus sp. SynAce01]MCT0201474.1 protein phosphatase [Synechococcus sp. CS-603]MCT0204788.1 protein phosphatase [Synechococcus sp. CS-602]MCT0247347.1 protein phosphatase [Synechococcus sp. CS-601]MCT4366688.1 protein phosphatase [Candidatus Regnicoccus frigidus MAG-AL2]